MDVSTTEFFVLTSITLLLDMFSVSALVYFSVLAFRRLGDI